MAEQPYAIGLTPFSCGSQSTRDGGQRSSFLCPLSRRDCGVWAFSPCISAGGRRPPSKALPSGADSPCQGEMAEGQRG